MTAMVRQITILIIHAFFFLEKHSLLLYPEGFYCMFTISPRLSPDAYFVGHNLLTSHRKRQINPNPGEDSVHTSDEPLHGSLAAATLYIENQSPLIQGIFFQHI